MDNQKKSRWNYFIYPRFQLSLILSTILIILGVVAPVLISIHLSFSKIRQMGIDAGLQQSHVYFRFISLQEHVIQTSLEVACVSGILISIVISILISHKVAGPIVRLREYFKALGDGAEVSPVAFRKGDFFNELPSEINRALEKMRHEK